MSKEKMSKEKKKEKKEPYIPASRLPSVLEELSKYSPEEIESGLLAMYKMIYKIATEEKVPPKDEPTDKSKEDKK